MGKKIIILSGAPARSLGGAIRLTAGEDGSLGARIANQFEAEARAHPDLVDHVYYLAPRIARMPVGQDVTWLPTETPDGMKALLEDLLTGALAVAGTPVDAVIDASAVCPYAIERNAGAPMDALVRDAVPDNAYKDLHAKPGSRVTDTIKKISPDTMLVASMPVQYDLRSDRSSAALKACDRYGASYGFSFDLSCTGSPRGKMAIAGNSKDDYDGSPYAAIIKDCDTEQELAEFLTEIVLHPEQFRQESEDRP